MRLKLLFFILLLSCVKAKAQPQADILDYIAKYKQISLEQEQLYGIPAPITLAQGILESGAGKSGLTRHSNNHFGVKDLGGWSGQVYRAWDDEKQKSRFRVYASAAESFRDHSNVLRGKRYAKCFTYSVYDYRRWAYEIKASGYATAPDYAQGLIGLIEAYRLYEINGGVKLKPGRTVIIRHKATPTEKAEFDPSCKASDDEVQEEEEAVNEAVRRFVVDINDVRCTILYPGQTLSYIARKYDIPIADLLKYNETASIEDFHEGDIVFIDKKKKKFTGPKDFHRVQKGESLYSIAQAYGIRVNSLARMNHLKLFDKVKVGDKLVLK